MSGFERIVAEPTEPLCPAGMLIAEAAGGTGCVCRITENLISSRHNPSTLARWCFHSPGYQQCPTWREDREELWRTKTIADLLTRQGDRRTGHPEDRQRNQALALAREAQEREQWEQQQERVR